MSYYSCNKCDDTNVYKFYFDNKIILNRINDYNFYDKTLEFITEQNIYTCFELYCCFDCNTINDDLILVNTQCNNNNFIPVDNKTKKKRKTKTNSLLSNYLCSYCESNNVFYITVTNKILDVIPMNDEIVADKYIIEMMNKTKLISPDIYYEVFYCDGCRSIADSLIKFNELYSGQQSPRERIMEEIKEFDVTNSKDSDKENEKDKDNDNDNIDDTVI